MAAEHSGDLSRKDSQSIVSRDNSDSEGEKIV
jgi:hypothetical protein